MGPTLPHNQGCQRQRLNRSCLGWPLLLHPGSSEGWYEETTLAKIKASAVSCSPGPDVLPQGVLSLLIARNGSVSQLTLSKSIARRQRDLPRMQTIRSKTTPGHSAQGAKIGV